MKKLTNSERIMFEQYFPYENMTYEEGDKYLTILLNSGIISDDYSLLNSPSKEVVLMNFKKIKEGLVKFNGAYTLLDKKYNRAENRAIDGSITKSKKTIIIEGNVERIGYRNKYNEAFNYYVLDVFNFNKDGSFKEILKTTFEFNMKTYIENRDSLDENVLEQLVLKKIR